MEKTDARTAVLVTFVCLLTLGRLAVLDTEIDLIASPDGDLWILTYYWGYTVLSDVFDGGLARKLKATSMYGEFLDHIIDKIVLVRVLIALVQYKMFPFSVAASLFATYGAIAALTILRIVCGLEKPQRLEMGRYVILGWSITAWCYMVEWPILLTAPATAICLGGSIGITHAYVRDFQRCWHARPARR